MFVHDNMPFIDTHAHTHTDTHIHTQTHTHTVTHTHTHAHTHIHTHTYTHTHTHTNKHEKLPVDEGRAYILRRSFGRNIKPPNIVMHCKINSCYRFGI